MLEVSWEGATGFLTFQTGVSSKLRIAPQVCFLSSNLELTDASMSLKNRVLKFEHRRQPLLSRSDFLRRFAYSALLALLLLAVWLLIGMAGYHWLAGLSWVDAFLNASMIVGGMGR